MGQPAELILRERFKELDCSMEFSDLKYVGTKTGRDHATDFTKLLKVVQEQLNNNSIRAPRKPGIVFKTLQVIVFILLNILTSSLLCKKIISEGFQNL